LLAPSHMVVGCISMTLYFQHAGIDIFELSLSHFGWAIAGSLMPDIDHRASVAGRLVVPAGALLICLLIGGQYPDPNPGGISATAVLDSLRCLLPEEGLVFISLFLAACLLIQGLFKHRTITHSLLMIVLLSSLIDIRDPEHISFFVGYVSHIMLDLFSAEGVQLFYPYGKRVSLTPHIEAGSIYEGVLVAVVLLVWLSLIDLTGAGCPWLIAGLLSLAGGG